MRVLLDHNLDWRLKRLLTGDKNFRYQQNLRGRDIALIVLLARWNILSSTAPLMPQVLALLPTVQLGQVYFVSAPDFP